MIADIDLYKALKEVIPKELSSLFSYIEQSKVVGDKTIVKEDTAVFYFRSANNPIRTIDGTYVLEFNRLVLNIFTHRGEDGVLAGHKYCKHICDNLDKIFNKDYEVDGTCFTILNCRRLGKYQYVGPNKQGIASFSINYMIEYEGGN